MVFCWLVCLGVDNNSMQVVDVRSSKTDDLWPGAISLHCTSLPTGHDHWIADHWPARSVHIQVNLQHIRLAKWTRFLARGFKSKEQTKQTRWNTKTLLTQQVEVKNGDFSRLCGGYDALVINNHQIDHHQRNHHLTIINSRRFDKNWYQYLNLNWIHSVALTLLADRGIANRSMDWSDGCSVLFVAIDRWWFRTSDLLRDARFATGSERLITTVMCKFSLDSGRASERCARS